MVYLNHIQTIKLLIMKKFYLALTLFFLAFTSAGLAQYTATNSGNWTSPITWAPGARPSTICNNCTVRINSGVTVQLDAHVVLEGNSVLYLGSGGTGAAELIIGNSGSHTINGGYNIIIDTLPGSSMVVLTSANSTINATAAGPYDGIFSGALGNLAFLKEIGNSPLLFFGNTQIIAGNANHGQTLSGPVTLFAGGTLPITLINFNAFLNNGKVSLTWTTEQEVNAAYFAVERSSDGSSWQTIGTVPATGNSSIPINYSYNDPSPSAGVNYYRLQSVDRSGRYIYSEVLVVRGSPINGLKIFPNPARSYVYVTIGNNMTANQLIRLTDLNGHILQERQVSNAAGTTITVPVNNYPKGIYMLQVKGSDGNEQVFRVLVGNE
jgi:hypothetical protein